MCVFVEVLYLYTCSSTLSFHGSVELFHCTSEGINLNYDRKIKVTPTCTSCASTRSIPTGIPVISHACKTTGVVTACDECCHPLQPENGNGTVPVEKRGKGASKGRAMNG